MYEVHCHISAFPAPSALFWFGGFFYLLKTLSVGYHMFMRRTTDVIDIGYVRKSGFNGGIVVSFFYLIICEFQLKTQQ